MHEVVLLLPYGPNLEPPYYILTAKNNCEEPKDQAAISKPLDLNRNEIL
jgi:hypothetical protein